MKTRERDIVINERAFSFNKELKVGTPGEYAYNAGLIIKRKEIKILGHWITYDKKTCIEYWINKRNVQVEINMTRQQINEYSLNPTSTKGTDTQTIEPTEL